MNGDTSILEDENPMLRGAVTGNKAEVADWIVFADNVGLFETGYR